MLTAPLTPSPSPSLSPIDNLKTYGLEKLAPSFINNMKLCGHKIVSVRSVSEKVLTISTKCIKGHCFSDHEHSRACLEVTETGLRLVFATFQDVPIAVHTQIVNSTFVNERSGFGVIHLKQEQYTCKDTSQLDSALITAVELYQIEVDAAVKQRKEELAAAAAGLRFDVIDTNFAQRDAGVLKNTMMMLQSKIKF